MDSGFAAMIFFEVINNVFYVLRCILVRHKNGVGSFDNHVIIYTDYCYQT